MTGKGAGLTALETILNLQHRQRSKIFQYNSQGIGPKRLNPTMIVTKTLSRLK